MTRTSDTFGALALATLTVFALWASTLTAQKVPPLTEAPAAVAPAFA